MVSPVSSSATAIDTPSFLVGGRRAACSSADLRSEGAATAGAAVELVVVEELVLVFALVEDAARSPEGARKRATSATRTAATPSNQRAALVTRKL